MNTVEFYITKEMIGKRIFATSAYTARARESLGTLPAITERMLATADDTAVLNPLIDDSINEVFTFIVRYLPESIVEFCNDGYRFAIKAPENFPADNGGKLKQCIESYIADRALQEWYANVKPDEAAITSARTQNEAATLQALLTQRVKPTRQEEKL